jgi:hypothetical protein
MAFREIQVYVVEVCRGCGWNHLVEQFVMGRSTMQASRLAEAVGAPADLSVASAPSGRRGSAARPARGAAE